MKKKAELRQILRKRRRSFDKADRDRKSFAIAKQLPLLDQWPEAKGIAVYSATDGEIDPKYITASTRAYGKKIFLPIVNDNGKLDFALWEEKDRLVTNRFNILEPCSTATYARVGEINIICLPLVGWDRSGNRLGMGGGFYDKTLKNLAGNICLVGLGFSIQEVDEIPIEPTDIPLDFVITENEIISNPMKIKS